MLYRLYLEALAFPAVFLATAAGFKGSRLAANLRLLDPEARDHALLSGIPFFQRPAFRSRWVRPVLLRVFLFRLFRHLALDLLSFLHGRPLSPFHLRIRDEAKLKALREKGGLLLAAHFHQWELLGSFLRGGLPLDLRLPLVGCALPLKNPGANRLLRLRRRRLDLPVFEAEWIRQGRTLLQSGGVLGFLWDQCPARREAFSSFLGQGVAMNGLPLFFGKTGVRPAVFALALPGFGIRLVDLGKAGRGGELWARRYNRVLELLIARHPTYWYGWLHRRFKGVPAP